MQISDASNFANELASSGDRAGYRLLVENMTSAFGYSKMLFDSNGKPVDFKILQVNSAIEKILGMKKSDDGVGMTDEVRSHLFEKGFGKGTGLGLHMIKRIIETYGWSIEENGKLGVCARFTMKIPENKFKFEN